MSITGKSSLSIKKQDLAGQKTGATGFKKVVFSHKAAAGETGINLLSLTSPAGDMPNFVQPSTAVLQSAQLKQFRNNLTLISSARGYLQDYLSYNVTSSTNIVFTDSFGAALDGEIFIGIIDAVPRDNLLGVDATTILATGVLPAGQTQFNVGKAFKVNHNPNTQIGEIAVYEDGLIQFRNAGNAAASPSADGNYHEVDSGSGEGTLIEFNESSVSDRNIMVVSTGVTVVRPTGSLLQEIESTQGQIDAMIPTLAALAGVPESTFQAAPNSVDLRSFGDRVLGLEGDQGAGNPRLATNAQSGALSVYEENNSWSPTIGALTNLTGTVTATNGWYIRVNNIVYGGFRVTGVNHTANTTYTTIEFDAPFAMLNSSPTAGGSVRVVGPTQPRTIIGAVTDSTGGNETQLSANWPGNTGIGAISSIEIAFMYNISAPG